MEGRGLSLTYPPTLICARKRISFCSLALGNSACSLSFAMSAVLTRVEVESTPYHIV